MTNNGRWIAVWALPFAFACGTTPTGGDDAGPATELPPAAAFVEENEAFVPVTLDMSCMGTRTRPAGGADIDVEFQLRDFQDDFAIEQRDVWLFTDNEIADDCSGANCQEFTTNSMGNATATMPAGGWYAYRVLPFDGPSPGSTVFAVFQYNEPAPTAAGMAVMGNSVSGTTIDLIPALLGIRRDSGLAVVSGRFEDCQGQYIQNAVVRIYDPDGNYIEPGTANASPRYHYFNGNARDNLPNSEETQTQSDGLYVAVQIPVTGDGAYRVEGYADLGNGTERIACESARIFTDAVTILNLGPMRADAPAACAQ